MSLIGWIKTQARLKATFSVHSLRHDVPLPHVSMMMLSLYIQSPACCAPTVQSLSQNPQMP